jgi:hypothetical protein
MLFIHAHVGVRLSQPDRESEVAKSILALNLSLADEFLFDFISWHLAQRLIVFFRKAANHW